MEPTQHDRCNVIFLGPANDDPSDINRVKEGLQTRFKIGPEAAERMIASAPLAVKRDVSAAEANKYRQILEAMGVAVKIESTGDKDAEDILPPPETTRTTIPLRQHGTDVSGPPGGREDDTPAMQCPQCGFIQPRASECVKCGVVFSKVGGQSASPHTPAIGFVGDTTVYESQDEASIPWEDMDDLGFVNAFVRTVQQVLSTPDLFFRKVSIGGILSPLLFGVLTGVIAALVTLLWQYFFAGIFGGANLTFAKTALAYAFLVPVLVAIGFFIISGVLHTALMVVGGNHSGFGATFRTVAYANSTQLISIVPLLGSVFAFIYYPVLIIVGLKEAHGITMGRAAFAVFVALIVALVLGLILLFMLLGPLLAAVFQMLMHQAPGL